MASDAAAARQLGAFDIGCIVVGGIIGVGIFFTPGRVAAAVDTPAQVMTAWGIGGLLAILGALVFAQLSRVLCGYGGTVIYIERAFGPLPAFVYGWANWLVIQAGALGVIGLVMVSYLDVLVYGAEVTPMPVRVAIAALAVVAFTLLNACGLRVGVVVQNLLTVAKTSAVFGLVLLALLTTGGGATVAAAAPREPVGWTAALAGAILPVLFSVGGWQQGSFVAGAARRPRIDVPLGLVGGVAVVAVAYMTVNLAFLDVLGFEGAAASQTIAEDAARQALAPYGLGDLAGRILSAMVVVSALGIMNTICLASPFVLHAMSKRGMFFAVVGRLHPTSGAPVVAVLVQGLWGAALLSGTYLLLGEESSATLDALLQGVVFVDWIFYAACGLALLRIAGGGAGVLGALFAASALAVAGGAVWQFPGPSLAGLSLVALGLPFFAWFRRRGEARIVD